MKFKIINPKTKKEEVMDIDLNKLKLDKPKDGEGFTKLITMKIKKIVDPMAIQFERTPSADACVTHADDTEGNNHQNNFLGVMLPGNNGGALSGN